MASYGKPLTGAIVAAGYGKQTEAAVLKLAERKARLGKTKTDRRRVPA